MLNPPCASMKLSTLLPISVRIASMISTAA
jgi:hypothetical protein